MATKTYPYAVIYNGVIVPANTPIEVDTPKEVEKPVKVERKPRKKAEKNV